VVKVTLVLSLASCSIAEDYFTDLVEDCKEFMVSVSETMVVFISLIDLENFSSSCFNLSCGLLLLLNIGKNFRASFTLGSHFVQKNIALAGAPSRTIYENLKKLSRD